MIFIDFDGVIADMHPEWCRKLNELHGTSYTAEDITDWGCSFLPEELRPSWFQILNHPDLYDEVQPNEGALETLAWLDRKKIDWRIATSCSSTTMVMAKVDWLIRHGIADRGKGGWPRKLIPISDKHLLRGDILLDDAIHNLQDFGGIRLLFDQPHNQKVSTRFHGATRVTDWNHFRQLVGHLSDTYSHLFKRSA